MATSIHMFWEKVRAPDGFLKAIDAAWSELDREDAEYFGAVVFAAAPPSFSALEVARKYFLVEGSLGFWRQLHELHWYVYFESSVRFVLYEKARSFVGSACSGKYETAIFAEVIIPWRNSVVATWLFDNDTLVKTLDVVIRESYVDARLSEMYEILADFPESERAVLELRDILLTSRQNIVVADTVTLILKQRVLHAGANTSQILDVYSAAVNLLKLIDQQDQSSDRLLSMARNLRSTEAIAAPVRTYLRERRDTIRCIVKHITESAEPKELVSMLVSIFGSRDVFANEYRMMLAEKLLVPLKVNNVDNEVEILELLKLRFQDLSFQQCEVMLRDVEDSTRLNRKFASSQYLEVTVISHVFWPPQLSPRDQNVSLHRRLIKLMSEYSETYNGLKAPRRLEWIPLQGSIKLELKGIYEKSSKTLILTVSPLVASLILFFDGNDSVSLRDLAFKSNVSEKVVRRKLAKWINLGVLQELRSGVYSVNILESSHQRSHFIQGACEDDDDDTSGPPCKKQHRTAVSCSPLRKCRDHEVYTSYILGMLGNLGELSAESIHNMLKMFANEDHKYALSQDELYRLLLSLCKDELLEQQSAGSRLFRLPRHADDR